MTVLRPRLGVNAGDVMNRADTDAQLAQARSLGFRDLRFDVSAAMILESEATDWGRLDAFNTQIRAHGLAWYPILCYSTSLDVDPAGIVLPDPATFARAAALFVARYKPLRVEVWNEPNMPQFWPGGTPQRYADLYSVVHASIPSTTKVVTAGLANRTGWEDYLRAILNRLKNRGTVPDAIGFHPYRNDPVQQVRALRGILNRHGLTKTKIDITEYGRHRKYAGRRAYLADTTRGLMALGGIGVMRVMPYVWTGDPNFALGPTLRNVIAEAAK